MPTLGEALPEEQARVRELLKQYEEIGPAGAFGAMMLEAALAEADKAAVSGDVVAMLLALKRLEECK